MHICIISESTTSPTGFGQQTKLLGSGFLEAGHQVTVLGNCQLTIASNGMVDGIREHLLVDFGDAPAHETALRQIRPDVCVFFQHIYNLWNYASILRLVPKCFFWIPWEGSTLPKGQEKFSFSLPRGSVVHLSHYAKRLWDNHLRSDTVIPHGVDLNIFKEYPCKKDLRKEWSDRLDFPLANDGLILLNVDRNDHRKKWDATFDLVRTLKTKLGKKVQLIAHTNRETTDGNGYNLERLEELFGLKGTICYSDNGWRGGCTQSDLAELYSLADYRISTSKGEGFGLPTIECAAVGTPQIVVNHTTIPEVLPKDSPFAVEPASTEFDQDSLWPLPNVQAMSERIVHLERNTELKERAVRNARDWVSSHFSKDVVVSKWLTLINGDSEYSKITCSSRSIPQKNKAQI